MIMNDGMTSRRVMRVCFAVAALALLACAQGCGESARPVATPLAASVSVEAPSPTMMPLPTAVPVAAATPAPSSTATPLPALMPTVVPLAASASVRRVPRDVSFIDLFSGSPDGAVAYSRGAEPTVEEVLEKGLRLAGASPVHVAVRGTASSDTVRCDWRGIARSAEQRNRAIRFWLGLDADDAIPDAAFMEALFAATMDVLDPAYRETAKSNFDAIARGGLSTEYLFLTCYANYTVSEYLLGSGPGTVTVAYDRMGEAHSYELYEKEYWNGRFDDVLPSRAEYEALLLGRVTAAEESLRARIGDHEGVVFLAPMGAHNAIAVESWQAVEQWDVQTVEGVVNAVRYGAGVGDAEHTQTLSGLRTRIRTAVGSSSGSGGSGGVSGQVEPESPPSGGVVSGQSDSSSGAGVVSGQVEPESPPSGGVVSGQSDSSSGTGGASGQSSSTTSSTSAPACPTPSAGSSASAATATATPAPSTPTPTPTRIANVSGLRGYYQSIGAYCFIGPYPTVTATATSTPTALSGGGGASGQTGSDATVTATPTPAPLPTFVPSQPPAVYAPRPGSVTATASGEDRANLTWTAVTGATGYTVQHRESGDDDSDAGPWRTASGSVTGTSYSVTGLWCGKEHEFRVGAYGDGTTYNGRAGLWSAALSATMGSCTAQRPRFQSASYSFDAHTAASVGGVVGKVSAYDVNGDTVTYSITGGNSAGKFVIGGSTGEITVAGSLGTVAVGSAYALTVGASDGVSGTASVTANVSVAAPTCRSGVAVAEPRSNYWLVRDCEALLEMRDALRGTGSLNWSAGIAMTSWDGVTVGWTPKRVSTLHLDDMDLTGRIPPEIGQLWGLLVFTSRNNQLSGEIPRELGNLPNLRQIILKSGRLSGRIPPELGNLRKLRVLILRRHQLSGEIPRELGNLRNLNLLNLTLNRLSGELPRELENMTRLGKVLLFDAGDTGNKFVGCIPAGLRNVGINDAHVSGLSYCNSAPVFGSSEYAFSVREDASVGSAVGSVSASDTDEGNTLSYSIVSGNVGGVFSMATSTGAIAVVGGLDYETRRKYGLTVVVNDGAGGTATTTASIGVSNALDVCLEGSAVSSPRSNFGLAHDCEVLLVVRDTLRGTGSLNWSADTVMTSWDGVTIRGTPKRVTGLHLDSRGLTGTIPPEISELSGLLTLAMRNNQLSGEIPRELGNLHNLSQLILKSNRLSGELPRELGNLRHLTVLILRRNRLSGEIPREFGNLSKLNLLNLNLNRLTGELPREMENMTRLGKLLLFDAGDTGNRFVGCIPAGLRNVGANDAHVSGLSYCNSAPVFGSREYAFSSVREDASVGTAVGTVSATDVDEGNTLSYSIVSGNVGGVFSMSGSTGAIAVAGGLDYETKRMYTLTVQASDGWGGSVTATAVIGVSNVVDVCSEGSAVSNPGANAGLANDCEVLLVAKDTLRGTGSLNWSTGTAMTSWDGVTVSGTPKRVTRLEFRRPTIGELSKMSRSERALVRRPLTGSIPPELGELSGLTRLDFVRNSLTGSIPSEIGGLANLTFFAVGANRLTGRIPSELGNLANLTALVLDWNQLTGEMPSELGSLSNLRYLHLRHNGLTGDIPAELGGLTRLSHLYIASNRFGGCVPTALRSITNNDVSRVGLSYCHSAPRAPGIEFEDWRIRVRPQSVTGATRYEVELSRDGSTRTTSCTSPWWCSFAGRVGQSYTTRARYAKSGTLSEWSTPRTFTFLGFLGPDSVTATRSGNSITVRWTPASGGVIVQHVRLLYTTSGCNSGARSWDGPKQSFWDATTSSHTFTNLNLSTYTCIFPVVYNYYPTGHTLDYAPTILVGKTPTPSIELLGSSIYVVPDELSGATSYEAELSGDGSTRTTTCTHTWGCTFTGRVGQSYTARVRYTNSAGVVSDWSESKTFTFRGVMSSGSVSATRSGSSVTVDWTPVAAGVVSQRVVLAFTTSGCNLSDRIWSGFSREFADGTTRTHTFTNIDLSEYACIFPIVINYFASDKTVTTYRYGSGVRLTSSDGVGGASGAAGASGQAESPAFALSRDLEFIRGLEAASQFEFDRALYAFSIGEDADTGAVVGVVRASAPDGPAESYSITAGNEDGKFGIGATSGEITVVAGLDYETTTSYTLTVEARDGRGGTTTATVEITVVVDVAESSVPGAGPRDLVANASLDSVTLRWVAPEGGTVTGYRVLRRRAQVDDAFIDLAVVATSTPMYMDTRDVVAGAQYIYRVVAVYNGVDGGDARVSVMIPSLGPRDLVAEASSDSVTLRWSAPEGGAVTGYRVLRRRAQVDDAFASLADVATSTPMYVDAQDVVSGAQYVYRVVAVYDGADGGDARVSVVIPLPGPRDLVADASLDSVTLRWVAAEGGAVTGYRVMRRRAQVDDAFIDLAEVVATSTPMYVDTRDVVAGANYVYRVVAVYDGADGGDARVSVVIPLPGPRDLVAEASSDSVTLRWVAAEDGTVTGYRVLRRRAQVDDAFIDLAEVVATSTPMYMDAQDVVAGANYVYRVVTVYDGADGGDVRVSVVIPLLGPRDLVADAASDSVTLRWVAPEDGTVTGYRVLRRRAQVDDAFVSLADVATSTPMYVDTQDVVAGAQYVYRVVAVYDGADGGDARVSVVIPLPGPRDLVADAASDSVTLRWVAPEDPKVTGYRVMRRRAQVDDAFIDLAEVVATSTPMYIDAQDVVSGAQYIYRVVAVYDGVDDGGARVAITTPSALAASGVPVVRRRRA